MSQTEVQLIKSSSVVDGDIVGMTSSKLSGALPAISGASLTGITQGINEADLWRLSSTLSLGSSWAVISANLERQDNTFSTHIGTGMSQSSGVFTFPSTGKWLIIANGYLHSGSGEMHYTQIRTEMSSDSGGSYTIVGYAVGAATSGGAYGNFTAIEFVDVTNASTFRCRFQVRASDANQNNLVGYTGENATTFTFVRLGDT